MSTRKEFIRQMLILSGGAAGMSWTIPESLKRAISIDPEDGSDFLDAEHVVLLMQENRSFDHCYGTLQGVRGYNDPRAVKQPNGNTVWAQSGKNGKTYTPFRFDINDTKITWMGSTPHNRHSQMDAWNNSKHDNWIEAKRPVKKEYADMPLTMGHYSRADLPFHYAMADAFTVCDQNFSSLIGPTRPNRLFYFTGTNRSQKSGDVEGVLQNKGKYEWKTMPEWLEENEVSWRIYQNDIYKGKHGLTQEEVDWLSNLGPSTNVFEVFKQYNAEFDPRYVQGLKKQADKLPEEIGELEEKLKSLSSESEKYTKTKRNIRKKKGELKKTKKEIEKWSAEQFEKLPQHLKNLHKKAFTTNKEDPDYRTLTELKYADKDEERSLNVPKGDMLYRFRKDVENGELPTVSWLVPSKRFSDHPTSPWYGTWYTSEVLDILTQNPQTWKKTIFILTYDENDGYFDHIPPFTAPDPADKKTGQCSPGVNISGVEYTYKNQRIREGISKKNARGGPIGLGFRVPMVIASPWSRGGQVCSQVFDHTSPLQFLEYFINKKYNKQLKVENISDWRRTVCGDLTAAFKRYEKGKDRQLDFLDREAQIKKIYDAQFKEVPANYKELSDGEVRQLDKGLAGSSLLPQQEPGVRPSCPSPYELYVGGGMSKDKSKFKMRLEAGNTIFGKRAAGAPFKVYVPKEYLTRQSEKNGKRNYEKARCWDYAIKAGDTLFDEWAMDKFKDDNYHLRVYGPNGFFREFEGDKRDPKLTVEVGYERARLLKTVPTGNIILTIDNKETDESFDVDVEDKSYNTSTIKKYIPANESIAMVLNLKKSFGWYDFEVKIDGYKNFSQRYAGHVETGKESLTDPLMGGEVKEMT